MKLQHWSQFEIHRDFQAVINYSIQETIAVPVVHRIWLHIMTR